MKVKEKLVSAIRGVLEYIYHNPLLFGFEVALVSGLIIFYFFERKKLNNKNNTSESSESNNDFL